MIQIPPAAFLTPLRLEKIAARRWLLIDDLVFRSAKYPGLFIAPRGFQTDLASIPLILGSFAPKVGAYDLAAVIHDGGYGNALISEYGERIFTVKAVADNLFLEGMRCYPQDISDLRARLMYRMVVLFGNPKRHPLAAHRPQEAT